MLWRGRLFPGFGRSEISRLNLGAVKRIAKTRDYPALAACANDLEATVSAEDLVTDPAGRIGLYDVERLFHTISER